MTERTTESILAERKGQHGEFSDNAKIACDFGDIVERSPRYSEVMIDPTIRVGLFMILHKIARALSGDLRYADHWDDIAGYAKLVSKHVNKDLSNAELHAQIQKFRSPPDSLAVQDEDANLTRLQYEKYERNQLRHQFPVESFESWLTHQAHV